MTARRLAWLIAVVALMHAGWTAWRSSWTVDEVAHLSWSQRLLDRGETARPGPFDNSKTPLMVAHVLSSRAAAALGARSPRSHRFAARLPTLVMLALLMLAVHRAASAIGDARAGLVALAGVALDPSLAGHGGLVTADVPFALATLLALMASFAFYRAPGPRRGALLGAALAFAFTAKFTALLLVPLALLVPLLPGIRTKLSRSLALGLAVAVLVAAAAIAASYRVVGVGDFVGGIARCLHEERSYAWNGYVLGRRIPDGAPYYFVLHWVVKTPLALAAATLAGLATARWRSPEQRGLAIAAAVFLAYFSLMFRTQVGYRYVLMVLPLVYVVTAPALAAHRRRLALVAGLALVELAPYRGNPLAFTSAVIPDKRLAYRVIADSNLSWGQTSEAAGAWFARQPAPRRYNPRRLGLGLNVLDVNHLIAVWPPDRFACIRAYFEPDAHLHFTHVVFRIDAARLAAMRARCPAEIE